MMFQSQDRRHKNCIRINTANSLKHEMKKLEVCYTLKKYGHDFLTEATFSKNGKRCDIVDLSDKSVIEIAVTEEEESLAKKVMDYPLPIEVLRL